MIIKWLINKIIWDCFPDLIYQRVEEQIKGWHLQLIKRKWFEKAHSTTSLNTFLAAYILNSQ